MGRTPRQRSSSTCGSGRGRPICRRRSGSARTSFRRVRPSAEPVGELQASIARRVGLRAGVPVILGGADSQACALGAGVVAEGPVSEMAGSSTCLNASVPEPLPILQVTHYPHVVPGPYTTETGINTTGAAVAWVADLLYAPRGRRAGASDYQRLDREAPALSLPEPMASWLSPALADGERTDPDLRGAFTGLSLRHGRGVIARAMMEGVAFDIREQLGPHQGGRGGRDRAARVGRRCASGDLEPDQGRRHRRPGGHRSR